MAFKDDSKQIAFRLWVTGRRLQEIIRQSTAQERSIRAWVLDWERGRQQRWDVAN